MLKTIKKIFLALDCVMQVYMVYFIIILFNFMFLPIKNDGIRSPLGADEPIVGMWLILGFYQFVVSNTLHFLLYLIPPYSKKILSMRLIYVVMSIFTTFLILSKITNMASLSYGWIQILTIYAVFLSFYTSYHNFNEVSEK